MVPLHNYSTSHHRAHDNVPFFSSHKTTIFVQYMTSYYASSDPNNVFLVSQTMYLKLLLRSYNKIRHLQMGNKIFYFVYMRCLNGSTLFINLLPKGFDSYHSILPSYYAIFKKVKILNTIYIIIIIILFYFYFF